MDVQATEPATILVVDDIASNRALARETLEDAGHRVIEANNGAEALTLFEQTIPDCVVLDIRMPGLSGVDVCKRMHDLPGGAEVPILFLTALRDLDTFDQALQAGGFDFLTKPVSPAELLVRVRAALFLRKTSIERSGLVELMRQQRDHLMRAVLMNERLASFLVHDLKGPVAGLQLAADMIRRDAQSSDKSREIAGRMHAQAGELLRMILGLLDLSKGEEGRLVLHRSRFDAGVVARGAAEGFALRAEPRHITVAVEGEGEVDADLGLFRRVLENLLDNGLRHAPDGSKLTVRLARANDGEAPGLAVTVADAGRGVPAELRERIFDRFVQADSAAERANASRAGRGLGLAFCKLVVEVHGGSIQVEDANPGALFVTRWPDG